jgi:hypothetical protein
MSKFENEPVESLQVEALETEVSLAGVSDAVGGLPCVAVWAVIAIYTAN